MKKSKRFGSTCKPAAFHFAIVNLSKFWRVFSFVENISPWTASFLISDETNTKKTFHLKIFLDANMKNTVVLSLKNTLARAVFLLPKWKVVDLILNRIASQSGAAVESTQQGTSRLDYVSLASVRVSALLHSNRGARFSQSCHWRISQCITTFHLLNKVKVQRKVLLHSYDRVVTRKWQWMLIICSSAKLDLFGRYSDNRPYFGLIVLLYV